MTDKDLLELYRAYLRQASEIINQIEEPIPERLLIPYKESLQRIQNHSNSISIEVNKK